ncbi:MAG TPA: hypothetical protein VE733_11705 [Streptosporangiaceae bacterium]|jgi:hypothetical protein|nr:hypothetical protein [Streptosporangiaceae bacterium]
MTDDRPPLEFSGRPGAALVPGGMAQRLITSGDLMEGRATHIGPLTAWKALCR